jgi:hypothetical protein
LNASLDDGKEEEILNQIFPLVSNGKDNELTLEG